MVYLDMSIQFRPKFPANDYLSTNELGHFAELLKIIQPRLPELGSLEKGSPGLVSLSPSDYGGQTNPFHPQHSGKSELDARVGQAFSASL